MGKGTTPWLTVLLAVTAMAGCFGDDNGDDHDDHDHDDHDHDAGPVLTLTLEANATTGALPLSIQ